MLSICEFVTHLFNIYQIRDTSHFSQSTIGCGLRYAFINARPILIECLLLFINKYCIHRIRILYYTFTIEFDEFLIEYLIGLWSLGALIKFNYVFFNKKNYQLSTILLNQFRLILNENNMNTWHSYSEHILRSKKNGHNKFDCTVKNNRFMVQFNLWLIASNINPFVSLHRRSLS